MTFENKQQKALFQGSVKIFKGDVTIYADRAEIYFGGDSGLPSGGDTSFVPESSGLRDGKKEISRIKISGNVRIQQGLKEARSENAVYEKQREIIVLTGNPVIRESGNEVHGEKITIFLNENKSVVEKSRVLIQPKSKE